VKLPNFRCRTARWATLCGCLILTDHMQQSLPGSGREAGVRSASYEANVRRVEPQIVSDSGIKTSEKGGRAWGRNGE
jgi:hypothetical protein